MKCNKNKVPMVRLGDYIEEVDERNVDNALNLDSVMGISTEKKFIETKANMNGVSLTSYKIVPSKGFAYVSDTSRRGDKISLAFNDTDNRYLVSSISTIFRVKAGLLPEYLYLLFCRSEFDRYARFNSWGSARETFDFSEMQRVQIPLPDIEVQKSVVAAYKGLKNLIETNEALIEPLQNACNAYVVDLKKKYPMKALGPYIQECDERNADNKLKLKDVRGVSIEKKFIPTKADMDGVSLSSYKVVKPNEFCYVSVTSRNGEKISLALQQEEQLIIVSSSYIVFKTTKEMLPEYLYLLFCRPEFDRYTRFNSWGSARETFDFSEMQRVQIPLPPIEIQKAIVAVYKGLAEAKRIASEAKEELKKICPALVQMAAHSA